MFMGRKILLKPLPLSEVKRNQEELYKKNLIYSKEKEKKRESK